MLRFINQSTTKKIRRISRLGMGCDVIFASSMYDYAALLLCSNNQRVFFDGVRCCGSVCCRTAACSSLSLLIFGHSAEGKVESNARKKQRLLTQELLPRGNLGLGPAGADSRFRARSHHRPPWERHGRWHGNFGPSTSQTGKIGRFMYI